MTRKEAMRLTMQADTLRALGFTQGEAESLRRISMTLHRWHELECGLEHGCIERDETTNKPYWASSYVSGKSGRTPIADRETGALKRLANTIAARNGRQPLRRFGKGNAQPGNPVRTYIQTDPRGAALYIIRPGDVPEGANVESYYSRGICVY